MIYLSVAWNCFLHSNLSVTIIKLFGLWKLLIMALSLNNNMHTILHWWRIKFQFGEFQASMQSAKCYMYASFIDTAICPRKVLILILNYLNPLNALLNEILKLINFEIRSLTLLPRIEVFYGKRSVLVWMCNYMDREGCIKRFQDQGL